MRALTLVALGALVGCGETTEPVSALLEPTPVADVAGTLNGAPVCDAGDAAFVERAILALWGRRSLSERETAVLVDLAQRIGRAELVRKMTQADAYRLRWGRFLTDTLQVARNGERANGACSGDGLLGRSDPQLAAHVRDNRPDGDPWTEAWNLTDLVDSALALDDISPIFRVQLFAMLGSTVHEPNNDFNELGYRRLYADIFSKVYLGRRSTCVRCHNSEASITGNPDPALDRTWEIPGHFEKAIFGSSSDADITALRSMFRVFGVHSLEFLPEGPFDFWGRGEGHKPWGMAGGCGMFELPQDLQPDPLGGQGYLVHGWSDTGTIWDVERLLDEGLNALRDGGLKVGADLSVGGPTALAWLTSVRLMDSFWQELMGAPLTLSHGFARNQNQRDLLHQLTASFVGNSFSLRDVLVFALTHPYFNLAAPQDCAGSAYPVPPVFNPWSPADFDEAARGNGVGDLVTRLPARVLMGAAAAALSWPAPLAHIPLETDELGFSDAAQLQRQLGVPLNDSERGFRGVTFPAELAWEEAIASCRSPFGETDEDFIDRVVDAATEQTMGALISVLRDRVLAHPNPVDTHEAELLAALAGVSAETSVATLDRQALDLALRRVCTGLLRSPWFTLQGVPHPHTGPGTSAPFADETTSLDFCVSLAHDLGMTCQDGRVR